MFPENHDGVIWNMACLVILVLTAVFLSMVMEKRFSFSKNQLSLQTKIVNLQAEEELLRGQTGRLENQLQQSDYRGFHRSRQRLPEILTELLQLETEVSERRQRRDALSASIADLEAEFSTYRETIRSLAWRSASGEKIGKLLTKNGRQYDDVVITSVTSQGLLITHSCGVARLPADELPVGFQRRFEWEKKRQTRPPEVATPQPIGAQGNAGKVAAVPVTVKPLPR